MTGDILLSVDHVNLIGMSLEEAQSFVDEKLKHKNVSFVRQNSFIHIHCF